MINNEKNKKRKKMKRNIINNKNKKERRQHILLRFSKVSSCIVLGKFAQPVAVVVFAPPSQARSVRGRLVVFIRGHRLSRDFAKMMLTHRPVYARPLDPLHNFKIKVTVKKVRSGDVQRKGKNKKKKKKKKPDADDEEEDEDTVRDPYLNKTWSYTFEWQEKKFSPREIFSLGPEKKGLDKMLYKRNQVEVGYHKQLTRLKNDGVDITPQRAS